MSDTTLPPQLFQVDQTEVATILAMDVPAHPSTTFNESDFKDLVARAFSITLDEKKELINKAGAYTQHQVNELVRILTEERTKWAELSEKHAARLAELEARQNN